MRHHFVQWTEKDKGRNGHSLFQGIILESNGLEPDDSHKSH